MLIALDAGHGGSDPGAVYNGRQEKDDNLRLAMAVGKILQDKGVDVVYTRENDIYETPFKKATDANQAGADYFISFHRNSGENPNTASGVQNLIYQKGGTSEKIAKEIQDNLVDLGFRDLGIVERPNLVVLRRTNMPAVLIETGFINNNTDNNKFDEDFDDIAEAIADAILESTGVQTRSMETGMSETAFSEEEPYRMPDSRISDVNNMEDADDECVCGKLFRVQVGAFKNRENADRLLATLLDNDFPAFIVYDDNLYRVQVGAFRNLDNAVRMERRLRRYRYNTFITT